MYNEIHSDPNTQIRVLLFPFSERDMLKEFDEDLYSFSEIYSKNICSNIFITIIRLKSSFCSSRASKL